MLVEPEIVFKQFAMDAITIRITLIFLLLFFDKAFCEQWPPQDKTYRDTSNRPKSAVGQGVSWITTSRPFVDRTPSIPDRVAKRPPGSGRADWTPSSSVPWQGIDRPPRQARLQTGSVTTEFSCRQRVPGYYADIDLNCQVYHLCNRNGGGITFHCPEGTRFQQRAMVCDHAYSVNCSESYKYYDVNLRIGHRNVNLLDDNFQGSPDVFMQVIVKDQQGSRKRKAQKMQVVLRDEFHDVPTKSANRPHRFDFRKVESKIENHIPKTKFEFEDAVKVKQDRKKSVSGRDQISGLNFIPNSERPQVSRDPQSRSVSHITFNLNGAGFHEELPSSNTQHVDVDLFDESLDHVGGKRDSRKSGHTFLPEQSVSDKRATSYTRVSFSKPFDFHPWETLQPPALPSTTIITSLDVLTTQSPTTVTTVETTTTATTTTTASTTETTTETPTTTTPVFLYITESSTTEASRPRVNEEIDLIENFVHEEEAATTTKSPKKIKNKKIEFLPLDHPLRHVIPPQARIVGVQPESSFLNPHVMTLGQFLEASKNMDKIHAIRVPLDDKKHIQMIERLAGLRNQGLAGPGLTPTRVQKSLPNANNSSNAVYNETINSMLEELKEIIALKAEKQIAEINFRRYSKRLEKEEAKRKSKKGLALQPRGGAPSARFVLPQEPPKLEFGFRPLTTQTVVTTTTPATTKFHFDDNDQLSAPRPPGSLVSDHEKEAFFFTTTTATSPVDNESHTTESQQKSAIFDFDMRKFFFIPNRAELQKTSANSERRTITGLFGG